MIANKDEGAIKKSTHNKESAIKEHTNKQRKIE